MKNMGTNITSLPDDIIYSLVRHSLFTPGYPTNARDMIALSKTCRKMHGAIQPVLQQQLKGIQISPNGSTICLLLGGELLEWGSSWFSLSATSPLNSDKFNDEEYSPNNLSAYFQEFGKITKVFSGVKSKFFITENNRILYWRCDPHEAIHEITERLPTNVISLHPCDSFNLCLTSLGEIYSWGENYHGQLGAGIEYSRRHVVDNPLNITELFPDDCGKIIKLSAIGHTCQALTDKHRLFSWGSNSGGQVGNGKIGSNESASSPIEITNFIPEDAGKVTKIVASEYSSFCLTELGYVYAWGINTLGRLGLGNIQRDIKIPHKLNIDKMHGKITDIAAGTHHALCLTETGNVFGFGSNLYGQLAHIWEDSSNVCQNTPLDLMPFLPNDCGKIIQIAAGGCSSYCITENRRIFGFGGDMLYIGKQGDTRANYWPVDITNHILCTANHQTSVSDTALISFSV